MLYDAGLPDAFATDCSRCPAPDSIQLLGEFGTEHLWRQAPPTEALAFEVFVQQWLERLARDEADQSPNALRETLREYVVPAVVTGEVRAAHARYS